jgi:hypothetical protein
LHLAINELSMGTAVPVGEVPGDAELVSTLANAILGLRNAVSVHDRGHVISTGPSDLASRILPGGTPFMAALSILMGFDPLIAELLLKILTDGPWLDVALSTDYTCEGQPAHGLGHASTHNGITISLATPQWTKVAVDVCHHGSVKPVVNVWQRQLAVAHRNAVAQHLPALPEYEDPGTHDPEDPRYIQGKSHLPRFPHRLLEHAITDAPDSNTWWALCEHGFHHRFSGSLQHNVLVVHWNGTTNPVATEVTRVTDIPSAVRRRLAGLEPVRHCGCRELG